MSQMNGEARLSRFNWDMAWEGVFEGGALWEKFENFEFGIKIYVFILKKSIAIIRIGIKLMRHELWPIYVSIFAKIPGFGDSLCGPWNSYMPEKIFYSKNVPIQRIYGIQNLPRKKFPYETKYIGYIDIYVHIYFFYCGIFCEVNFVYHISVE